MRNIFISIVLVIFILINCCGCFSTSDDTHPPFIVPDELTNPVTEATETIEDIKESYPKFNEPFVLGDWEILVSDHVSFAIINNDWSDYHLKEVVTFPVTVKNIGVENQTFLIDVSVTGYGSKGTEVAEVSYYFVDDNYVKIRPNASITLQMSFIYDGNGIYALEFDDWFNSAVIETAIVK